MMIKMLHKIKLFLLNVLAELMVLVTLNLIFNIPVFIIGIVINIEYYTYWKVQLIISNILIIGMMIYAFSRRVK